MGEYKEKIYPRLEKIEATAPSHIMENNYVNILDPSNYRLQHINDIKKYMESQCEERRKTEKKYKKVTNNLDIINYSLNSISVASAIASVSTLPTIALIPLSIILGGISGGTSLTSIILSKLNKKYKSKQQKHHDIFNLGEMKLNNIERLMSKALIDQEISDSEFSLIMNEESRFRKRKEEIRRKLVRLDIEKVREESKKELKDSITEPINSLMKLIRKI